MERRYLVAAVAIIATFAVFSRGLQTLERVSLSHSQRIRSEVTAKCNANTSAAARLMGKVRTRLRPSYPEEAQLLAEMNLPIVMAQAQMARQLARQNIAAVACARARAMREAERARRDAMRMRDNMTTTNRDGVVVPMVWRVNASDVDQRVEARTAALAQRMAAQTVRLQMAAEQIREASEQLSDSDNTSASSQSNGTGSKGRCKAVASR